MWFNLFPWDASLAIAAINANHLNSNANEPLTAVVSTVFCYWGAQGENKLFKKARVAAFLEKGVADYLFRLMKEGKIENAVLEAYDLKKPKESNKPVLDSDKLFYTMVEGEELQLRKEWHDKWHLVCNVCHRLSR